MKSYYSIAREDEDKLARIYQAMGEAPFDQWNKVYKHLAYSIGAGDNFPKEYDLQTVKALCLINNINNAFAVWETSPGADSVVLSCFTNTLFRIVLIQIKLTPWCNFIYNRDKGF